METQVLIVGAGPTGLAAACLLTKLGISVRIIDQNHQRSDKSKALGVQAGTLECLQATLGKEITEKMVKAGRPARQAFFHLNDQAGIKVELGSIPSEFNFILILAQSETEKFLEKYLESHSLKVERETQFIEVVREEVDFVTIKIKNAQGKTEEVKTLFWDATEPTA